MVDVVFVATRYYENERFVPPMVCKSLLRSRIGPLIDFLRYTLYCENHPSSSTSNNYNANIHTMHGKQHVHPVTACVFGNATRFAVSGKQWRRITLASSRSALHQLTIISFLSKRLGNASSSRSAPFGSPPDSTFDKNGTHVSVGDGTRVNTSAVETLALHPSQFCEHCRRVGHNLIELCYQAISNPVRPQNG